MLNRRNFLRGAGAVGLATILRSSAARALAKPIKHPQPRAGITSANVLPDEKLPKRESVRAAYAAARANPEIFDGLGCVCGCADEHRSLLTCYETAQPTGCQGCRELAVLVGGMIAAGKDLDEIRAAFDNKYG